MVFIVEFECVDVGNVMYVVNYLILVNVCEVGDNYLFF